MVLLLGAVLLEGKPWENFDSTLPGTKWKIDRVSGAPVEPTYAGMLPFLAFDINDRVYGPVYGLDTCGGTFQGTYRLVGDQVMFTDMAGALLACPLSMSFGNAMDRTRSWRRDWDKLYLYDATGTVTFQLSRNSSVGYKTQGPRPTDTKAPSPGQTVPDSSRMAVESPSRTST
jgi:heat shock protein HslJ